MLTDRFAPSPTGELHLGHAFSAWLGWHGARVAGGRFLLRLEDLDRQRSRPEFEDGIYRDLGWLGIDWDEGPFFQSTGVDRHRAAALRLREEGTAYRDFSDPEEVREEAKARSMHPSRVAREKAEALGLEEAE